MILGIDEAGRGPVIGPLVITGFAIKDNKIKDLENIKPKDSKQLSKKTRELLFRKLNNVADKIITKIIKPKEIDNALKSINLNYLELLNFAMIINEVKPDKVFIDAIGNKETSVNFIRANLNDELRNIEIIMEEKADSKFLVVSAASIIAKVIRDKEIEKIKDFLKRNNINVELGSGYSSDPITIKFLNFIVSSKYFNLIKESNIIRKEWQTFKNLINKNKQSTLNF